MRGLKHVVFKVGCLWTGHTPALGSCYSVVLGRRVDCIVCQRCLKVL